MRIRGRILIAAVFVSALMVICLTSATAQQPSNYPFLEVVDINGKPVKDAKAESFGYYPKFPLNLNQVASTRQTYDSAKTLLLVPPTGNEDFLGSIFRVSKNGYFTFQDLGTKIIQYRTEAKIELFKIPATEKESRLLGNKQLKREFLLAAKKGDAAAVRKLLRAGISPNLNSRELRGIPGPLNVPAILFAASSGDGETVKVLLDAGAKIHQPEVPNLRNILAYYLLADPFSQNKAQTERERKRRRRYEDGFKQLLEAKAEVSDLLSKGQTALMLAAQQGSVEIVKILLKRGMEVDAGADRGWTALMSAIYYSDGKPYAIETIKTLLKAGADPNLIPKFSYYGNSESILMIAVRSGKTEVVKTLVKSKADLNFSSNNSDYTALKIAKAQYSITNNAGEPQYAAIYREVIQILEAAGAK